MTETAPADAPMVESATFPAAGLDRRFYAFAVDRGIAWPVYGVAAWFAWTVFLDHDRLWPGLAVIAGTVVVVGGAFSVVLGLTGLSPGKAMLGLRAVHHGTGTPVGVGRALVRGVVLGIAALPTFGLGVATLAWTAVMDPGRQRRGWHDHVARSVVVDVRPVPVHEVQEESGPRHIVNLTAMRLVPSAAPPEPVAAPRPRPEAATARTPRVPAAGPETSPPAPSPAQPAPDSGRTVVRGSAATSGLRWRVVFDTGDSFVVEGLGLVGRRPEPRSGEPVRHVVPLPSADMSLSKTHAQFHLAPDGVLVVMDRGSTNGSVLVRQGVSRELAPGKPATLLDGDRVRFGDREMTVARES
ncbi:MAG: RDD family protein [Nocardioides sp.]